MLPSRSLTLFSALVALLSFSACNKGSSTSATSGHASSAQPSAATDSTGGNPHGGMGTTAAPGAQKTATGTVEESMDAAGYTYLRLKTGSGDTWAVVPQTAVNKGANVTVDVQMVARNFHSKALNRDFDTLIFGLLEGSQTSGQSPTAQPAMPAGHPAMDSAQAPTSLDEATTKSADEALGGGVASAPDQKISKASGTNGHTVAELWAERKALAGKTVAVHGKVVKYLPGILGKNWLHLRDGSGTSAAKDDDLTVTTQDTAKPGDVVTATGTVEIDKDFGAGYAYPVIVEGAKISQ